MRQVSSKTAISDLNRFKCSFHIKARDGNAACKVKNSDFRANYVKMLISCYVCKLKNINLSPKC